MSNSYKVQVLGPTFISSIAVCPLQSSKYGTKNQNRKILKYFFYLCHFIDTC